MPKVSVIVPVFEVEKYIERCARSLFCQDFDDIEFLFINDCSEDKSIDILYSTLEEYPQRLVQMRVINLEQNTGIANVRRIGIEQSKGEYILFCDSDDYVEHDMVSSLYHCAETTAADCVLCDYYEENKGQSKKSSPLLSTSGKELVRSLLYNKIPGFIWRGLYSKDAFSKVVTFPSCSFAEDIVLNIQVWLNVSVIEYLKRPLYHYCLREGSLSTNRVVSAHDNQMKSCKWVTDFVSAYLQQFDDYDELYSDAIVYFNRSLVASRFTAEEKYLDKDIRPIYKIASKVNFFQFLGINRKEIPIKEKVIFVLDVLNILPFLYRITREIKRIG